MPLQRGPRGLAFGLLMLLGASAESLAEAVALRGTPAVLNVALDEPAASASAGSQIALRLRIGVSAAAPAQQVVGWISLTTLLDEDFGQSESLQFVSATNGGQFTTVPLSVAGVEIPGHSLYWSPATLSAGGTFAFNASVRVPAGALNGTRHEMRAFARASNSASMPQSLPRGTNTLATPRPAVALQAGAGWSIVDGVPQANPGQTVELLVNASNGDTLGTETLHQPRSWLRLQPLCDAASDSTVVCIDRITSISDAGIADPAFDPDGDGPLQAEPAVIWTLPALAPGASLQRSVQLQLSAGIEAGTPLTLSAALDSARSAAVSGSEDVVLGVDSTPQATLAVGDDIGGALLITAGVDDHPAASAAPGAGFTLGIQFANGGASALGDILHFLQIPPGLRFANISLPANGDGRVFYANTTSPEFADPDQPPPVDLSAVIGNAELPSSIDAAGNSFWTRLDVQPPADPATIRWLAVYRVSQTAVEAAALTRIGLQSLGENCSLASVTARVPTRVHAFTPAGSGEVAITPQPLLASDSEPLRLAGAAPAVALNAAGATFANAGSPTPSQVLFNVQNIGASSLDQPLLLLSWPPLSINGVLQHPEFVSASGGTIDASQATTGELAILLDPIAAGASLQASVSLRYPAGIVRNATHAITGNVHVEGGQCADANAADSRVLLLLGEPQLSVATVADQPTLVPGGEFSFSGLHQSSGTAVAEAAFVYGRVPEHAVFRSARLPPGRRLRCSAPPLDAALPASYDSQQLLVVSNTVLQTAFVDGVQSGKDWHCPQGESTSWLALALDDLALAPPSFAVGPQESWQLFLRNEELRDEPDVDQLPSPIGTTISLVLAVRSALLLPAIGNASTSQVDDQLLQADCAPPLISNRDALDYAIPVLNGKPPLSFSLIAGSLPGCVALGADGRLTGGSLVTGEFDFGIRVVDGRAQQVDVACRLRVIEAAVFRDGLEAEPLAPMPPGPGPCPS
jgi:hypothetical protein